MDSIITISLPIIGALAGYYIKYYIDKKKDLSTEISKERRELYQQFINLIVNILSATKKGEPIADCDFFSNLFEFYKKYILYASPEVINSFSDYFQYLYATNREEIPHDMTVHFKKLSKIMKGMRTDLGLSNKSLGHNGEQILRALITDFDKIIK